MEAVARLVGLVALLVSLPLLWMGWVLAANLTGLLMLNERRTLGLTAFARRPRSSDGSRLSPRTSRRRIGRWSARPRRSARWVR